MLRQLNVMGPLSELVAEGAPGISVVFGADGERISAARLMDTGAAYFSEQADSDRVGLLMTNDRPTVEVVLGALATGTILVSLPIPGRGADISTYATFLHLACETHGLDEIVVADEYAELLGGLGLGVRRHSELGGRILAAPGGDGFSLVQFTSGSTRQPRPIAVSDRQLGANIAVILETLAPQRSDAVVSWLPLSHDMGLVGMFLAGVAAGCRQWAERGDVVLLDPAHFLRRPTSWLEALHHWNGTFTAAPDFGYRLTLRRPPSGQLDLSRLRCAIIGGEIVRADTLSSFASTFESHGLSGRALSPAYGMAELGLAATLTRPDEQYRTLAVSTRALAEHRIADPAGTTDTTVLVASGESLPGYEIDCLSADVGAGAIALRGPSLGIDGATGRELTDADGWYRPGDIGFLDGESLFVCGRIDDYIVANGRNLFAPAIEAAVGKVPGVRPGRVTAVGLPTGEWTLVAELTAEASRNQAAVRPLSRALRQATVSVSSSRPDRILLLPPGELPLTSSGKLQRNLVRTRLISGQLNSLHEL